jgi:hypothetical protein
LGERCHGTVAQTMKRTRLTQLLTDEVLRRGIPVDFGRRLTGATSGGAGRVVATLDDGTEVEADLVVVPMVFTLWCDASSIRRRHRAVTSA